jgi:hypothetical protein
VSALPPFLTEEEIAEATKPLRQGAARIKFFKGIGCKVKPRPNGQPLVGRADFEAAMTARREERRPGPPAPRLERPDWQVIPGFKRSA